MPRRETVEALIAMVEANEHDAAIERFYTEDASMQENGGPPRTGTGRASRPHAARFRPLGPQ